MGLKERQGGWGYPERQGGRNLRDAGAEMAAQLHEAAAAATVALTKFVRSSTGPKAGPDDTRARHVTTHAIVPALWRIHDN